MSAAFKEWALVCEALGSGRQSVILRKGGLAEGREGFAFRHDDFFLFPTWFHAQLAQTVLPPDTQLPEEPGDQLEIRYLATVEWKGLVTRWETVCQLSTYHILHESVVKERFSYAESPGLHVAFVRVFRLDPPAVITNDRKFGGCRSWVELPDLSDHALVSVISDEEHERRRAELLTILGQ